MIKSYWSWLLAEKRIEMILFFLVTLISLIPVFSFRVFPTLDGPAHLYNARLVSDLIFNNTFVEQYHQLNPKPIPNWLSHLILAIFSRLASPLLAEKLMVSICIAGLAYAFRYLVRSYSPSNSWLSFLIFPFAYSFFLYLGFFNFILSVIILFVLIAQYIKLSNKLNLLRLFWVSLMAVLLYFSHIFGFFAFLIFIATLNILIFAQKVNQPFFWTWLTKTMLYNLAIIILPTLLYLSYAGAGILSFSSNRLPAGELFRWLYRLRSLVVFHFGREQPYTTLLVYTLAGLTLLIILRKFNLLKSLTGYFFEGHRGVAVVPRSVWLVSAAVLLVLYFVLPNMLNAGGYVTDRLNYLFFLFLALWVSSHDFLRRAKVLVAVIALGAHLGLLGFYFKKSAELNSFAEQVMEVQGRMKPESVVLTLNHSDDWMHGHLSNYAAITSNLIMLENYEAYTEYFPVVWNWRGIPKLHFGDLSPNSTCLVWPEGNGENPMAKTIDYVIFMGSIKTKTECNDLTDSLLNSYYALDFISSSGFAKLYSRSNR